MEAIFTLLIIQGVLGGFDNLWHHEIKERLPSKISARGEMGLHAIRELSYGIVFLAVAWGHWFGTYAWVLMGLLILDVLVTIWDFLIEDQTRKLTKLERATHTVLTINFGIFLALYIPRLWQGAKIVTGYESVSYGAISWILTGFGIGVFVWGIRSLIAHMNLTIQSVPEWQRRPIKRGVPKIKRRILITGGTGFIGSHLTKMFIKRGHSVWILTRNKEKALYKFGPHIKALDSLGEIQSSVVFDSIINLAGARVVGPLWSMARKKTLQESRLRPTLEVLNLIRRLNCKPEVLITASAIGFYHSEPKEQLDESSKTGNDFPALLCRKVEGLALAARQEGVRVVPLRIGLVLSPEDGFLSPFLVLAKFGLAPQFGSGKQWLSWIHIEDLKNLVLHTLHNEDIEGPVNATAPAPIRQHQFVKILSSIQKRPRWLKIPVLPLQKILGEMASLFLEGKHVVPKKALVSGFRFQYPLLRPALEDLVLKPEPLEKGDQRVCNVYYNRNCPVCRTEIDHYQKKALTHSLSIGFQDINVMPEALEPFGLSRNNIRRRLYVLTNTGKLVGGADAFSEIWRDIPSWRWGEKALKFRPLYFLSSYIYEGWMVPVLWLCNEKREKGNTKANHAKANG